MDVSAEGRAMDGMSLFPVGKDSYLQAELDKAARICVDRILFRSGAKPHLTEEDKRANIDGDIMLLDSAGCVTARITVQLKHYPAADRGRAVYSVPASLPGYAARCRNEVVMLIAADEEEECFYWKYIDDDFIEECASKGVQNSYTYHFQDHERADAGNIGSVVERWREICRCKIALCRSIRDDAEKTLDAMRAAFKAVPRELYGCPGSHIVRPEEQRLYEAVGSSSGLVLLTGDAGCGKSVMLSGMIDRLEAAGERVLPLKADMMAKGMASASVIDTLVSMLAPTVIVIDQIDALSQSMSADRSHLNDIMALIGRSALRQGRNVRVVVSCRDFDLSNDPALSTLERSEGCVRIRVGLLPAEDVAKIVPEAGDGRFAEMLTLPQNLDIYCRVRASGGGDGRGILSRIDLYDELWRSVICCKSASGGLEPSEVETVVQDLAMAMEAEGSLCVEYNGDAATLRVVEFLKSEGIVAGSGMMVRFFHQTFYEYVVARSCAVRGESPVAGMLAGHQGLFVRSRIKFVCDYLRRKSPQLYRADLLRLTSVSVRPHLRLMTMGMFAEHEELLRAEKSLVATLRRTDPELFHAFVGQVRAPRVLEFVLSIIGADIADMRSGDDLFGAVCALCERNIDSSPREVADMIASVADTSARLTLARRGLRVAATAYAEEAVCALYREAGHTMKSWQQMHCLERAAAVNPVFAAEVLEPLLVEAVKENRRRRDHSDLSIRELADNVCAPLMDASPWVLFDMLLRVVRTAGSAVFFRFNSEDGADRVPAMMAAVLTARTADEPARVRARVAELLAAGDVPCARVAMEVMAVAPDVFVPEFMALMEDAAAVGRLLDGYATRYHLHELIKKAYRACDVRARQRYRELSAAFTGDRDRKPHLGREWGQRLYPWSGYFRWLLYSATPCDDYPAEVRRDYLALERKYAPWGAPSRPQHSVTAGIVCSGTLVSPSVYRRMSVRAWRKSFRCDSRRLHDRYFSPHDHAKAFTEVLTGDVVRLGSFAISVAEDASVLMVYRLAAISGLLASPDADACLRERAVEALLGMEMDVEERYELYAIFALFTDSELMERYDALDGIARRDITRPFRHHESATTGVSDMLMAGANSIQGYAVECMASICRCGELRRRVYGTVGSLFVDMPVELQIYTLWCMSKSPAFDEALFPDLLSLAAGPGTGLFVPAVIPQLAAFYWYTRPELLLDHFENAHPGEDNAGVLPRILFFGTAHEPSGAQSRKLLGSMMESEDAAHIAGLVKVALEYLHDADYAVAARDIVLRYLRDTRPSIADAYRSGLRHLGPGDFAVFAARMDVDPILRGNEGGDATDYLSRCVALRPADCFGQLRNLVSQGDGDNHYGRSETAELLFSVYRHFRETEDGAMMEEIMDLFDTLTASGDYGMRCVLDSL